MDLYVARGFVLIGAVSRVLFGNCTGCEVYDQVAAKSEIIVGFYVWVGAKLRVKRVKLRYLSKSRLGVLGRDLNRVQSRGKRINSGYLVCYKRQTSLCSIYIHYSSETYGGSCFSCVYLLLGPFLEDSLKSFRVQFLFRRKKHKKFTAELDQRFLHCFRSNRTRERSLYYFNGLLQLNIFEISLQHF